MGVDIRATWVTAHVCIPSPATLGTHTPCPLHRTLIMLLLGEDEGFTLELQPGLRPAHGRPCQLPTRLECVWFFRITYLIKSRDHLLYLQRKFQGDHNTVMRMQPEEPFGKGERKTQSGKSLCICDEKILKIRYISREEWKRLNCPVTFSFPFFFVGFFLVFLM